jgi:16S rRNA (uracil1498-N3)-methyltransferase
MRRFFVEEIEADHETMAIVGSEARQIFSVLRMEPGDRFILFDGKGRRFRVRIISAGRKEVRVTLERALEAPLPSPVNITLCQALLKSRGMDDIIRRTSELGVNRIIPFTSERTVVRMDARKAATRVAHWRTIARDAAKQSDRRVPAGIAPITSLENMLAELKHDIASKIVLWEQEQTRDFKELLRTGPPAGGACIGIVGPEGGFSKQEIQRIEDAEFRPASVGNRVLRAGTAGLTLVALVQYEWGDLGLVTPG